MNAFMQSIAPLIDGHFIADIAVKTCVLFLLALVTTAALRRRSASIRHGIWTITFAAALALPVMTTSLPTWRVPLPGWTTETATAQAHTASPILAATADEYPARAPTPGHFIQPRSSRTSSPFALTLGTLTLIWAGGAIMFLIQLGIGTISAGWTSRNAKPVASPGWQTNVASVSTTLGIRAPVRVVETPRVSSPMTWGIFKPILLLPDGASTWSVLRRRAVVVHELGHIKRRDCLIQVIVHVVRALHWFNPLAWVAARRLRMEQERACDDLVLNFGTGSADYADVLLDVASAQPFRGPRWATASMARPSELEGRLVAVLDPRRDRRGFRRPVIGAALGLVVLVTLPLAAFQATPAVTSRPDSESQPVAPVAAESVATASAAPSPSAAPASAPKAPGQSQPPQDEDNERLTEQALAAMVRALADERASMRAQAAHALGTLENPSAVPSLADAIDDSDAKVRKQVAWALGMIEDAGGVPALVSALDDADAGVRSQSAWALGMVEGEGGVAPLVSILQDPSEKVRSQAAWALGMIESTGAVEGLIASLRSDDSEEVRLQAAWALGMIEDEGAADALIDALENDTEEVAEKAMWALSRVIQ